MLYVGRLVGAATVMFVASTLAGCSSAEGPGPAQAPASGTGGGALGGAPQTGAGGAGNAPPVSTSMPGSGGGGMLPPGSGGTPVVGPGAGGAPTESAGGAPPNGGAAGANVGGAAGANVGGAAGGPSFPGSDWTTKSNLDASGKLIAPAPGQGFQLKTPLFDLNPGQEIFNCYHVVVPNTDKFEVGDWESQMSGGSHHFILYRADGDTVATGTLAVGGCTLGFGGSTWLYTGELPHKHLSMPENVAMELAPNQRLIFDMHYINTGVELIKAGVTLNINKSTGTNLQIAEAHVSFNTQIRIPPNGTQTVGGDCTPPSGAKYFIMTTHTHKRGVNAKIVRKLANQQMGEVLVNTDNWDAPTAVQWMLPPFLTFAAGEKFHYSCDFKNDRATTVTVGTSAETNEMCMAVAYFFPASGGLAPACN